MRPAELAFPYRLPRAGLFLAVAFFGACSGFLLRVASENDAPLRVLRRVVTLSPVGASAFYAAVGLAGFGLVACALWAAWARVRWPQRVALGDDGLVAPRWPWSRRADLIPYGEIAGLDATVLHGTKFLLVRHARGRLRLNGRAFPSRAAYEVFVYELRGRVKQAHAPAVERHAVYARIVDAVDPVERGEKYEDPLGAALAAEGLGEVTGGGTMLDGRKEIEFVGIDLELTDLERGLPLAARTLAARGAPAGSTLEYTDADGADRSYPIHP